MIDLIRNICRAVRAIHRYNKAINELAQWHHDNSSSN